MNWKNIFLYILIFARIFHKCWPSQRERLNLNTFRLFIIHDCVFQKNSLTICFNSMVKTVSDGWGLKLKAHTYYSVFWRYLPWISCIDPWQFSLPIYFLFPLNFLLFSLESYLLILCFICEFCIIWKVQGRKEGRGDPFHFEMVAFLFSTFRLIASHLSNICYYMKKVFPEYNKSLFSCRAWMITTNNWLFIIYKWRYIYNIFV